MFVKNTYIETKAHIYSNTHAYIHINAIRTMQSIFVIVA